ncbi:MAG TPA: hypothetical protein VM008_06980 [Phycisphaerae bacterium]|nr:hypothetical protein [Phycisphaerae bacterium]
MMLRKASLTRAACVALLTLATLRAARAEAPAVLNQVPADANAVIVINNVKNLSTKISNAVTRLSMPVPVPPDLAGFALRNIGITEGFDQDSSAALVILKPANAEANGDQNLFAGPPPAVMLLPTTDSKAMLQNLSPSAPDKDGISEVTLPGDTTDKGYVANVDKWVALAQDRDVLNNFLSKKVVFGKVASPETLKTFESNDLVVWANTAAASPSIIKLIEDKQQEVTGMMDLMNLNNNQGQTAGAFQKEMVNAYFSAFKEFVKDANHTMLTLRLSDTGLTLGTIGAFKPESPFGKFVAAQKPKEPPTLAGLPDGEFLVAGALTFNGASMADLLGTVSKQVFANEVIAQDPKIEEYKKTMVLYEEMATLSNGASMVLLPPPANGKIGFFYGAMLADVTDPAKYRALQLQSLKGPLAQESMNPDFTQKVTVTPDAVTVKDVKLTKINMKFGLREETADHPLAPGSKQGIEVIKKMYGEDGLTMYTGIVNKRILSIFGSDQAILEGAVDAAQNNSETLSNNAMISGVKDQVVANPVAFMYLPIARWVAVAQSMIKPGSDVTPVPNIAPVLASAGVTGNTLTMELHVPINAITSTIEAGTKFKQAMSGQGGGGGNGGAPMP